MSLSIVSPQTTVPLTWQVPDPSDANTYYPQITVQNSLTLAVLAVLDLSAAGNGLYVVNYNSPADPSGQGTFWMTTLRVWTDSGHSVISQNYEIENVNYESLFLPKFTGGSGGGYDVDYTKYFKKLEELLLEQIGGLPAPAKMETIERTVARIVAKAVKGIPKQLPYEKPVELERIAIMEQSLGKVIQALISHSTMTKQGLEQITTKLSSYGANFDEFKTLGSTLEAHHEKTITTIKSAADQMNKFAKEHVTTHTKEMAKKIDDAFADVETVQVSGKARGMKRLLDETPPEAPKPKVKDYSALAKSMVGLR